MIRLSKQPIADDKNWMITLSTMPFTISHTSTVIPKLCSKGSESNQKTGNIFQAIIFIIQPWILSCQDPANPCAASICKVICWMCSRSWRCFSKTTCQASILANHNWCLGWILLLCKTQRMRSMQRMVHRATPQKIEQCLKIQMMVR